MELNRTTLRYIVAPVLEASFCVLHSLRTYGLELFLQKVSNRKSQALTNVAMKKPQPCVGAFSWCTRQEKPNKAGLLRSLNRKLRHFTSCSEQAPARAVHERTYDPRYFSSKNLWS